jgi:heme A synthase
MLKRELQRCGSGEAPCSFSNCSPAMNRKIARACKSTRQFSGSWEGPADTLKRELQRSGFQVGGALPRRRYAEENSAPTHLAWLFAAVTLLVLAQLILGATMRHQHAGLAVPDFPLAYGKLWPATDPDSVAAYNRARLETQAFNDITAKHILVHMAHRLTAVAVFVAIGTCVWLTRRKLARGHPLRRLAAIWFALVVLQFGLGAWTVWSNKAADITTLHVVTGALTLLNGATLTLVAFRCLSPAAAKPAAPLALADSDSRSSARFAGQPATRI